MTIAIWYFDIMVRQAIIQNINDHMWMYYYRHFVEVILSNMEDMPFPTSEQNRHSRNFYLIEEIFSKMMDWKRVSIKSKNCHLTKCVYDCMGQCIYELVISDKLNGQDKHYLMNWVWEDLIKTFESGKEAVVEEIIIQGFKMFRMPSMLFSTSTYSEKEGQAYLRALNQLWNDRDTPVLHGTIGERANRFKTEVIDALS